MKNQDNKEQPEQKEEFCSVCVAGVTALAGAGTAGAGSTNVFRVSKRTATILFWIGIIVSLLSVLYIIRQLRSPSCNQCLSG
jgi:hypothetical protein